MGLKVCGDINVPARAVSFRAFGPLRPFPIEGATQGTCGCHEAEIIACTCPGGCGAGASVREWSCEAAGVDLNYTNVARMKLGASFR